MLLYHVPELWAPFGDILPSAHQLPVCWVVFNFYFTIFSLIALVPLSFPSAPTVTSLRSVNLLGDSVIVKTEVQLA